MRKRIEQWRQSWDRRVAQHMRGASRGMTLIEIMVVIAIIGILASAISFGVFTYLKRAKVDAAKTQLRKIAGAVVIYAAEEDFPSSLSSLTESGMSGLKPKDLKDPWRQEILYRTPGQHEGSEFEVCSGGADKQEGTEDDICCDETTCWGADDKK